MIGIADFILSDWLSCTFSGHMQVLYPIISLSLDNTSCNILFIDSYSNIIDIANVQLSCTHTHTHTTHGHKFI